MDAKEVISEILETAKKVSTDTERIAGIFSKSGITLTGDLTVSEIQGDAMETLKALMGNLSEMAVVKISAKQVVRRAGISL